MQGKQGVAMFGEKKHVDEGTLPIFVHALQSADAFELAAKVWEVNKTILRTDPANNKEFERFVFKNPDCVVWLQRDHGRTDAYELILIWNQKDVDVSEVYTISAVAGRLLGDDSRAKELLQKMLTTPATVPAA